MGRGRTLLLAGILCMGVATAEAAVSCGYNGYVNVRVE